MNKLNMNNSIINDENNNIVVSKDSIFTIINHSLKTLNIEVKSNCKVIINDFRIIDKEETNIEIKTNNQSSLIYNHSFINKNKYELNINTTYKSEESEIILNIHGINDNGSNTTSVNGNMSDKKNNILIENIRLININNGKGIIIPNILVEISKIIASHNATIGTVSEDELSYLMSKGISKSEAKNLILTGFLINLFKDKEFTTKMKEIINWR
ncbi:MAG: SufD family Fe-S cluster assembly protein [Bacilli bacterium]|nr:SufD family Fe-S cluster assembly protein [Bacilli bacterium]